MRRQTDTSSKHICLSREGLLAHFTGGKLSKSPVKVTSKLINGASM